MKNLEDRINEIDQELAILDLPTDRAAHSTPGSAAYSTKRGKMRADYLRAKRATLVAEKGAK